MGAGALVKDFESACRADRPALVVGNTRSRNARSGRTVDRSGDMMSDELSFNTRAKSIELVITTECMFSNCVVPLLLFLNREERRNSRKE